MKQAMGSRAAYAEAVRRWGNLAFTFRSEGVCKVGFFFPLVRFPVVRGSGKTWTLAFADADRRAGKKGEHDAPKPV